MTVAHVTESLVLVIVTETALPETDPETIGAVYYQPFVN